MYNDTNKRVIRGEIYYIEKGKAPGDDGSIQHPGRPGIIVSNDANNIHSETVEVVYLTTAPKTDLPTHCTIVSATRTSTAICEQIQTVSKERLGNYIGLCTANEMEDVDRCLAISLGLKPERMEEDDPEEEETQYEEEDVEDEDDERITELYATIKHMETELLKARTREETYHRLYDSLLEKVLG